MNTETKWIIAGASAVGAVAALGLLSRSSRYSFRDKAVFITGGSRGLGLLMAREFAEEGARVTLVSRDGESAVPAALALKPHVILMDIGLPGMSGYDAARRIRAWKPSMPVRIVALTGRDKLADRQRSAEAGIDHHVVKPADPAVLQRIFDSTLAARAG